MYKQKNIKKRVLAVFVVLLILSATVLSAFPVYASDCVHGDVEDHVVGYDDTYHYYKMYCNDCKTYPNGDATVPEAHNLQGPFCTVCDYVDYSQCSHSFECFYEPYNEIQHVSNSICTSCGYIDTTYYNYHYFEKQNGVIKCTYCKYSIDSYEGHYVSSISYINGVNYTITTNDSIKQLNRDFVTDEYGDFNVSGWCYFYFGVSQYYFVIYADDLFIDVIPAVVNSADTLNVGQKLAVQNRASLGFHYNESWCANSAFDLTAELGRYNGGSYDVILCVTTGAGVSVQIARFHTVTVEVTKVKETEETTEEPTEAPTEEPTEAPTEEPIDKPTYTDRGIFGGCEVSVKYVLMGGDEKWVHIGISSVPFDDFGMLDMKQIVEGFVTEDIVINSTSICVYIHLSSYASTTTTRLYLTNHPRTSSIFIQGFNDYETFVCGFDYNSYSITYPDDADNVAIKELCFLFTNNEIYENRHDFKIYSDTDAEITDLLTGVFDGMFNVFYNITNFDILGFNISSFLMGLLTVAIGILVVKVVLACIK